MIEKIERVENMLKVGDFLKLYRVNYNGMRIYINENPFAYYSGLTSALASSTFNGDKDLKLLKNWREDFVDSFGKKNADDYLKMTADFGTLLHTAIVTIKEKGQIDWNEEKDKAFEYFLLAYREKLIEPDTKTIRKMTYQYQKHVASMLQFCYDNVQEIYGVEVPVKWEGLKIATPIDIICLCKQTPKGEFYRTTINIKTSAQIHKSQYEQIACELMMWNETYPDKADFTGILRTVDWKEKTGASYEYKYLPIGSASIIANKCAKRLEICLDSDATYYSEPSNRYFEGVTKLGQQPSIVTKTLQDEFEETLK